MEWEYIQGYGFQNKPFGYYGGWFVNWQMNKGELFYKLESEIGVEQDDFFEVTKFIDKWIESKKRQEYSRELEEIRKDLI